MPACGRSFFVEEAEGLSLRCVKGEEVEAGPLVTLGC